MKYKSYQVGGVVYSPIGPSQQVQQTTSSSSSDTKSEKISGTMKEEIVKILKENGIPSDVDAFLNKANQFLNKSTSLSNMSLFGGTDDDYDLTDLITIQKMANDVRFNNERYKTATSNLDSENAWADVAIDNRGYMWVTDGENLKTVSASEFDPGKYHALTNEQLLAFRERSSQFAMDTGILNSMSGVIGMGTIQNHIVDLIKQLGTSSMTGYSSKEAEDIMSGAKILMQNGPDGFYKITDKQQARSVSAALNYIKDHINANSGMRNVLRATIAANGGDPTKDMNSMIAQMLSQHVNTDLSADFDSTATTSATKGSTSTSEKTSEQTLAERYASGNGFGTPEWTPIMTSNLNTPMYISAQNLGPILTKDMKQQFGDGNVENILNNAYGLGAIVDRKSITFGDIPIEWDDVSKLMYEADTNLQRVYLPVTIDGEGKVRPNFELQATIDQINSQTEGMTVGQIKSIISDIPDVIYNENTGMVEATNVKPFITFGAVASSDAMGKSLKTSNYLHELTNEEDRKKKDKYNKIIGERPAYIGSGSDKTNNPRTTWWMGYKFYEGNVFIPINDSIIAASIFNNQLVPQDTYTNMSAKAQAHSEYNQRQMIADQMRQSGQLRTNF